ncbi:MAG: 2Fe-2S iron-sulfur cluster binding domain-containing protein [Gammaproteobacteria bacterium]|jgi:ferredoxin|nr:2Fe-2S iron-sulfur cluster binding domain-containing protein [Gammaproteobacteria bacterium]MCP4879697.1 2Fe-2S iron-sulfur cluster binding domain-containing protein [Gammaproteobacteria bacterium]MDP6166231.1 class I ribonucleotide reductase maintenance protein YfaE [Gammaproteobacteria bacterium]
MSHSTVTVNKTTVFDYDAEFSLLDSMEENQVPANYNCRGGYCGLCKIKLTQGQVTWVQDSLVSLDADEVLACCCVPDGPISIEM